MQVLVPTIRSRSENNIRRLKRLHGVAIILLGLVLVSAIGGCAFVNIRTPYDRDLDRTELGSKTGVAEAYSLFWLVAWGDASYETAARNGNITVINHADQEIFQVFLGFYTRWRVVVYGD